MQPVQRSSYSEHRNGGVACIEADPNRILSADTRDRQIAQISLRKQLD